MKRVRSCLKLIHVCFRPAIGGVVGFAFPHSCLVFPPDTPPVSPPVPEETTHTLGKFQDNIFSLPAGTIPWLLNARLALAPSEALRLSYLGHILFPICDYLFGPWPWRWHPTTTHTPLPYLPIVGRLLATIYHNTSTHHSNHKDMLD